MDLFECKRLSAKITERQCKLNRNGYRSRGVESAPHISCQGCAGLGEPAQVPLPEREEIMKREKINCSHPGCYYGVKKVGDICKKHQGLENQLEAGMVGGAAPAEKKLSDVITDTPQGIQYDSEEEKSELAGAAMPPAEPPATPAKSGLSALLRTPPQPDGLLIPFSREEVIALIESEVTAEDIRTLVIMGLEGKLRPVEV